jgi:uncharacterized membrane protein
MKQFLTTEQEAVLVEAICEQEQRTSAEIRVCVTYKLILRPERYAWQMFDELGMRGTERRNGTLIVMMPRMRKVVLIGDRAIHAVVAEDFWRKSVQAMIDEMHESGPLEALRTGLRRLGDTLSAHWPRQADDVNELPDDIIC